MPVDAAWFGTMACTAGDVVAAGLGIEAVSMAVTGIPPKTCMARNPAMMASTMATKPSVGRTGPLADGAGVVRTAGSFLWVSGGGGLVVYLTGAGWVVPLINRISGRRPG